MASAVVKGGSTVAKPKNPIKTSDGTYNYVFRYWYLDGENTAYNFKSAVTGDITLTAKWNAIEIANCEVSFNSDGGTEIGSVLVKIGQTAEEPVAPTKASDDVYDYKFLYWYLDDENTAYDFNTAVNESITLTAKWTKTVKAGDFTVKEVTFTSVNAYWNNYVYDVQGYTRYSILQFTGGISSGHHSQGQDLSDLIANTAYTGSNMTWGFISSSLIYGPDKEDNNQIIFRTSGDPAEGDEIKINAGAWFITGGTINEKYVLTEDIELIFMNGEWACPVAFSIEGITWNGSDQRGKNGAQLTAWGIENDGAAAARPLVGTCVLLDAGGVLALMPTENLVDKVSGIKYNGVEIKEIDGALVAEWLNRLFIYIPYRSGLVTIESGATVGTKYTDNDYYYILNEYAGGASWVQATKPQLIDGEWVDLYGKQEVKFSCVNVSWNNVRNYASGDERLVQVILDFDYTDENKPEIKEGEIAPILWLGKAASSRPSAVAKWITVNGVKLSEIAGAYVDYSQGYNHMYITMPESALLPTDLYSATELEIKKNAVFEDSILPELTLTLIGGAWVVGDFGEYGLPADGYTTVSDVAEEDFIKVYASDPISGVTDSGDVDFRFVLSADSLMINGAPAGYMTLYLKSTLEKNWDGFRFEFCFDWTTLQYVVKVYDASTVDQEEVAAGGSGHKLIGTFPVGIAANDQASFAIRITENNGAYDIVIVEDGLKLGEIAGITPRGENVGNAMLIYSPMVEWTFKDYKAGDVSAPMIYVNTREEYFLEEGDALPEFEYRIYDRTDTISDVATEILYDEDAFDSDNKVKAGEYAFEIIATDKNGNTSVKTILLHVVGEQSFRITFDGKHGAEYSFGSLIVRPEDPEKAATNKVYYLFDGWYNGDEKWDFENDVVSSDLNLVPKFIEKDILYKITFTGVGDEDIVIYAKYGVQVDTAFIAKSGYDVSLSVNGADTETVIVNGDLNVVVSYQAQKGGCGSDIDPAFAVVPALVSALCFIALRRKENGNEKED